MELPDTFWCLNKCLAWSAI